MTASLSDALERLYRQHTDGIKFGLDTERAILARLGDPQAALACVHVAGTNGKGSVCSLLESVLRAAGLRTGLYTSPHLVRFHERFRMAGQPIPDADLAAWLARVEAAAQAAAGEPGGRPATFFEVATALAFAWFRDRAADLVVLETGMGGRLDATNVVRPLLAVITGISLDHTDHLGRDRAAIAAEKAGIIKPGRPVIVGPLDPESRPVIERVARERDAPLLSAADLVTVRRRRQTLDGQRVAVSSGTTDYGTLTCPLLGRHQLDNLAVAVAAIEVLRDRVGLTIPEAAVAQGVATVSWPARCQVLERHPLTLLDGAHNPEGAVSLAGVLRDLAERRPVALVVGLCADKDADGFLKALGGRIAHAWAVPLRSARGLAPALLAAKAGLLGCPIAAMASVPAALDAAIAWAGARDGVVCIAGSLYLAGEVLEARGAAGR